jgi:tRNA-modifying protein YgfZ
MDQELGVRIERLGARSSQGGEVLDFGDFLAEYRSLREAAGFAVRFDRGLIRMWGRDPVRMLNGLITQQVLPEPTGRAAYGAMLTPKGRIITDLRAFVVRRSGAIEVLVDVPIGALAGTRDHLKKFVPPLFARWEDLTGTHTTLGAYGPSAGNILGEILGDVPRGDEDSFADLEVEGERVIAVRTDELGPGAGWDLLLSNGAAASLWDRFERAIERGDARPVGIRAIESLRVEAGRPRFGRELTEETMPAEAYQTSGLMDRAISFKKGCYTGQEVVVRIAHRGRVNRHLRGLRLGSGEAPAFGTPLLHPESGKQVGWITTSVQSPRLGQTIGLAYLRREIEPGDRVRVGEGEGEATAEVVELPFQD